MSDFYRRSAERYVEEMPSIGYIDILARRARGGSRKALSELVEWLAGIAEAASYKKAHIARYRGVERDDMRQAAMLAMLEGLSSWDPQKSAFRTYAYNLAYFAVLNILNESFTVSMPRNLAVAVQGAGSPGGEKRRDVKRARPETLEAARAAMQPTLSLMQGDPSGADDEETTLGYAPEVADLEQGYEDAIASLTVKQVAFGTDNPDKEKKALAARFGLLGDPRGAIPKLAEEEGVSPQQIYNRANKGLRLLRRAVAKLQQGAA